MRLAWFPARSEGVVAGLVAAAMTLFAVSAHADGPYELNWTTIDGGGVTYSTGGSFRLGGTIGQPDAGSMNGGLFVLDGGFWFGGGSASAVDDGRADPDGGLPRVYRLYQGAPNPFNPRTQIAFDLPQQAFVQLRVYDLRGELVRTLVETTMPPGHHLATWDGNDQAGAKAASGAYVFVIDAGDFHARQKGLLLK